jgi:hypothetical protein
MDRKISHITHYLPWDIRIFGGDVIRHMAGGLTDDNKVTNNRIDCFLILLKSIEFHLINIVLDLFDGIKDIRNSILPQSTRH